MVIISEIRARERYPGVQAELIRHDTQPFVRNDAHNCLQALLVIEELAVYGAEVSEKVSELALSDKSLCRNVKLIEGLLCGDPASTTGSRAVRDPSPNKELEGQERQRGFTGIAIRTVRLFVVRICDWCRVDHAVMFHANNGIIVDSGESKVLLISA